MKPFLEVLQEGRILVFDGAMGTQLEERGLHPGPQWNIEAPETIADVHRAYLDAGADILLTNTFSANRLGLEHSGLTDKLKELNTAGVELCKKAADGRAYVSADIGSTGQLLEPYGTYTKDQFREIFEEQVIVLAEAGVDLFTVETMTDINEIVIAIKACKSVSNLPVIASMSFNPGAAGPRTMMGNTVEECARAMAEAGADVIGANCGGITPEQMAEVIAEMKRVVDKPLAAQPNAGLPELIDNRAVFNLPPDAFAAGAIRCIDAGAVIVGGCCGTTPAHIAALRHSLDSRL